MERRKKRARGMYEEIERDRIGKTYTERVTQTETHREGGMLMCVLHPKGSLTQYGHRNGGQSTARVHWPKSLLFTHTIPPSNIPVSTCPLRITALTEVESM